MALYDESSKYETDRRVLQDTEDKSLFRWPTALVTLGLFTAMLGFIIWINVVVWSHVF